MPKWFRELFGARDAGNTAAQPVPREVPQVVERQDVPAPMRRTPATTPYDSAERRPSWMVDGMRAELCEGSERIDVVGESHRQNWIGDVLREFGADSQAASYAILVAEDGNPYDANAVSVWIAGKKMGYLSRADAETYRPGLVRLYHKHGAAIAVGAKIFAADGRYFEDGRPTMHGVVLWLDPTEFGVEPPTVLEPRLRTGFSKARHEYWRSGNQAFAWVGTLSEDSTKRMKQLKRQLSSDTDPISRHYAYDELEATLYKLRGLGASVLEQYDDVIRQHDQEMDAIRPALLSFFGCIPLLDTYRQASIRFQKEDPQTALRWAERGLELYGQDAGEPENVADLETRAQRLRARRQRAEAQSPRRPVTPTEKPSRPQLPTGDTPSSATETLVCGTCGQNFIRTVTRGRKPSQCPDCKAL